MNISLFKATIAKNPLLDPYRYTVQIDGPIGALSRDQSLLCANISLPGRGFATIEQFHHGPVRKVPYSELYDEIITTFYVTEDLALKDYFDEWHMLIAGEDYFLAYYKDIVGSVVINTENRRNQTTKTIKLIEAYPMTVGNVELAYADNAIVPVIDITWAFHHPE